MDGHSHYVIQGYSDKGVGNMAICAWIRDVIVTTDTLDKEVGSVCTAIHGMSQ